MYKFKRQRDIMLKFIYFADLDQIYVLEKFVFDREYQDWNIMYRLGVGYGSRFLPNLDNIVVLE